MATFLAPELPLIIHLPQAAFTSWEARAAEDSASDSASDSEREAARESEAAAWAAEAAREAEAVAREASREAIRAEDCTVFLVGERGQGAGEKRA